VVVVDKDECTGCETCVEINQEECTECETCVSECPVEAIKVK